MAQRARRFSAIVLAAGMSTRMHGRNKLLLPVGAEPVIRRSVRNVLAARPRELIVVTGHEGEAVAAALEGLPIRVQANPGYVQGQMSSVAAGAAQLAERADAVMICLGDMVLLQAEDYLELADALLRQQRKSILIPRYRGARGNPVVVGAIHLAQLVRDGRNLGCRRIIDEHPDEVLAYETAHDRCIVDLDTPADYARVLARLGAPVVALGEPIA